VNNPTKTCGFIFGIALRFQGAGSREKILAVEINFSLPFLFIELPK
jgi:hypothetical protein